MLRIILKKSLSMNDPSRKPYIVAGLSLLAMAILAAYANFGVLGHLITDDNASNTALQVKNSLGSLRIAIVCFVLVAILDVIVAVSLYKIFSTVNKRIAKLATIMRLAYAGIFLVAISQLFRASLVAANHLYAKDFLNGDFGNFTLELTSKIDAFNLIWASGLSIFGLHLILIGLLIYRANFAPKILGALLGLAGLGYLIDSLGTLFINDYALNIAAVTFIGEVALIFWLLIKGRRLVTTSQ